MPKRRSRFERSGDPDPLRRRDDALAFEGCTAWQTPGWFDQISVVLLETANVVNIGGVARAMANTGFSHLRLINPAPFDAWDVIGIAHYTQHIIGRAPVLPTTREALGDCQFTVGFTGIHHRAKRNVRHFRDALAEVEERARAGQSLALLFGKEDTGLPNDALDLCHAITTIPTSPAQPSLNLAQAVLLTTYALFERAGGHEQAFRPHRHAAPPATTEMIEQMCQELEHTLEAVEFLKTRARSGTMRSLRTALYRAELDRREVALLRAAMLEVRRFLKRRGVITDGVPAGRQEPAPGTTSGAAG